MVVSARRFWKGLGGWGQGKAGSHNGLELSLPLGSYLLGLLSLSQGGEERPRMSCQGELSPWILYFFLYCCA